MKIFALNFLGNYKNIQKCINEKYIVFTSYLSEVNTKHTIKKITVKKYLNIFSSPVFKGSFIHYLNKKNVNDSKNI